MSNRPDVFDAGEQACFNGLPAPGTRTLDEAAVELGEITDAIRRNSALVMIC